MIEINQTIDNKDISYIYDYKKLTHGYSLDFCDNEYNDFNSKFEHNNINGFTLGFSLIKYHDNDEVYNFRGLINNNENYMYTIMNKSIYMSYIL